jgi:hypothetical protein
MERMHLQHQAGGGRWVLKCSDHVFALPAIRTVYPDARLVFVHRDPLAVLLSVARLTDVLRRPFTRRIVEPTAVARNVVGRIERKLAKTYAVISERRAHRFLEGPAQDHAGAGGAVAASLVRASRGKTSYHTCMLSNLRLVLSVDVQPGDQHSGWPVGRG